MTVDISLTPVGCLGRECLFCYVLFDLINNRENGNTGRKGKNKKEIKCWRLSVILACSIGKRRKEETGQKLKI